MQWSRRQCCMPQPCGHPALQKIFGKFQVADTKANSLQLFKKLSWAPFYDERKLNKSILVYKRISGDCPSCMTQVLIRNVDVIINERTSRRGKFEPCLPPIQTGVSSIRYSNKLGSGLRQFRSSSLSNCFKQAIHVPPFYADGFETRNGKLVYNVLKKISSHIKI